MASPSSGRAYAAGLSTAASETAPRRRMLLISYHFPPAQSAGALRWEQLSARAAEYGWGVDVVALDPAQLQQRDDRRLTRLPADTRVFGVPRPFYRFERLESPVSRLWHLAGRWPAKLRRASRIVPGALPEVRPQSMGRRDLDRLHYTPRELIRAYYAGLELARDRRWALQAAEVAAGLLKPGVHQVIVTCGPPHMVHEAGRRLSRRTGLPLVMDLRDPWSLVERLPEVIGSPVWLRTAERFERSAVRAAALVVSNTQAACEALQATYPEEAERCITVMNGFDDDPIPASRDTDRFLVAYAGSIYLDRNPQGLFRAAAQVVRELGLAPDDFAIELMGDVHSYDGVTIESLAEQAGIGGHVRVLPARPRPEAMEFLAEASMLVSLPQDSNLAVPSKVFEYMRFDAWLLALAGPGSATDQLLRGSGADVVAPDDVGGMAAVLRARYTNFREHGRPSQPAMLESCSRREQARRLFTAVERIVGTAQSRGLAGAHA